MYTNEVVRPFCEAVAADDQIEIAVAREVGRARAAGMPDRKELAPLHAEAVGPAPEDEASVRDDLAG